MTVGRKVLFAIALPWTLTVSYPYVLLAVCLGFARDLRWHPGGVLTATWRTWWAKIWHFSTTVGKGQIFHPSADRGAEDSVDTRLEFHEQRHDFQVEDLMLLSLLLGTICLIGGATLVQAAILYWSGGLFQIPNFLAAGLRYGPAEQEGLEDKRSDLKRLTDNMYRQSEHERSAYAQTDLIGEIGGHDVSWDEIQRASVAYRKGNLKAWIADNL